MTVSAQLVTYNAYYMGPKATDVKALIYAKDGNGRLRVRIIFKENGTDLPNSSESVSQGVSWCRIWFHIKQFSDVIDILRNEDPVWVYYSNPTSAHIYTGSEPIGEGELPI